MSRKDDQRPAAETYLTHMETLIPLIEERLAAGQTVRFSPRGGSMLPMLRQGIDSVTLSPVPQRLRKYDLPLYRRDNGQYVLHRVVATEAECYTCMGDDQFRPEHGLRHEQMIAVVTAFARNGREHSTQEWAYRLYCRVWHFSRPLRHLWRRGVNKLRRWLH